jgi:hypothetical protein
VRSDVVGGAGAGRGLSGVRITSVMLLFLAVSVIDIAGGDIGVAKTTSVTSLALESEAESRSAVASTPVSNSSSITDSASLAFVIPCNYSCSLSSAFTVALSLSASLSAASAPVSIRFEDLSWLFA